MSYSQSLEQTNTVLHFTDIRCSSGTDSEPSCCSSLLLILNPTREQEKKPQPTSKRVMGKTGRIGDGT